jgi:hypothetical protein
MSADQAQPSPYQARKGRSRQQQREQVQAGQDIGPLPPIGNPARRSDCSRSFRVFCETYFAARFYLTWSNDHLTAIARVEAAVLRGGNFALAMPRGDGKSALLEVAVLWGVLYGHHRMVAGLCATKPKSLEMMESITIALETNELLGADFPEVCYPIRKLEGTANRAAGQTYLGERTWITWKKDEIVLPFLPGSPAAGAVIKVGGLTGGAVRGMKHARLDGSVARPSLVIIDDPQTDATARSETQNKNRENLISGAVLGMAGLDRKIAAMMATTVIQPDDMADRMLNPQTHPDWQPLRTKLIYKFPTNTKLWEEYAGVLKTGLRRGDNGAAATLFYRHRQAAMDDGSEVAWLERYDETEVSAVQHAMNLLILRPAVFWPEYQNDPAQARETTEWLDADAIAKRTNGLKRNAVPVACNHLTLFADVHDRLLYWLICAWEDNFTGYIVDYGTYPAQPRRDFAYRAATKTLGRATQGAGREGAIYAGLKALCDDKLARVWKRDDGAELRISTAMLDADWETVLVHKFIREHPAGNILPYKGVGLTAASAPWDDRQSKPGEHPGDHWRLGPTPNRTAKGRHVVVDTNHWKTVVQRRLALSPGDPGALTIYATDPDHRGDASDLHRLLAEHLVAETAHETMDVRRGRSLIEWRNDGRKDNHWLDCLVGCTVLASMLGASAVPKSMSPGAPAVRRRPRKSGSL